MLTKTLMILNKRGLHARASAKFVKVAEIFDAEVTVCKDGTSVSGCSIMGLMMLAAAPGCEIELSAKGPSAEEAMKALEELVANKFDED
ncbi:HPr family phosphocarrier protein [uncultured Kiloniella sp.]|uniref:HPr family phosphocarrier protein n=2 Tax=Kiloniella TaxID=454159 RepID=UPI00261098F0|nr:HPr family phosphocarrier protein [uncultured Kiloniella sp.]